MKNSHSSSKHPSLQTLSGIWFVTLFAMSATLLSQQPFIRTLGLSPLIIGILLGGIYANTLRMHLPAEWVPGLVFATRPMLRFAIVLYAFRISIQDLAQVGLPGFTLAVSVIVTTLILGYFLGTRLFKMDRDTALLTTIGSSICGAAAVLAAEPVLDAKSHKSSIAVATVVIFGTISMFLFPLLFRSGILEISEKTYGMYVGGTIHEVAHAVAAGNEVSFVAGSYAVITKMIRVLLLAPVLLVISFIFRRQSPESDAIAASARSRISIPWFAVFFILVVLFNSLHILSPGVVEQINAIDIFLLTMSMSALGMETNIKRLRQVGPAPFYLAGILFLWLYGFGFIMIHIVT